MNGIARALTVSLFCAAASSACKEAGQRTLTDTEGRSFLSSCEKDRCTLSRKSGEPVSADKSALSLSATGQLVAICDVPEGGQRVETADCRPLVCKQDDDCPALHGMKKGVCINGLCNEPANSLNRDDVVLLCLAGTGLGRSKPEQVERYAMALNCGDPCRVPSPCRKP